MDILCRICGEPWDIDTIHEAAAEQHSTFDRVSADFRKRGCKAFGWGSSHCVPQEADPCSDEGALTPAMKSAILQDLLGDDIDGIAAMTEDLI